MKRIERWVLVLIFFHAVLLIIVQWMILNTDMALYINPVYEYFGVNKIQDGKVIETIDQFFQNVLSF